jgi:bifunctional non-homologous end joining protein LigD
MIDRFPAASGAWACAQAPTPEDVSRIVGGEGRFTLRHRATEPFGWSLTLERAGGALTWALPAGVPWGEGETRPATSREPGVVPDPAWDGGACVVRRLADDPGAREVLLEGKRILGRYALRHERGVQWRMTRLDPASLRPMPERVLPMLAHAAPYPPDPERWGFEIKWDGVRALVHVAQGRVRAFSRTTQDVTAQYPELASLADLLPGRRAILDGEVVAFDGNGRPSFQRLQARLGIGSKSGVEAKMSEVPVVFVAFDILYLDGRDLTGRPYEERRATLESLGLEGESFRVSPAVVGDGRAILALPGIEGVVAKRLGSAYEPGARSGAWRKIKLQRRQELVIGGWTPGRGARKGRIGAILVGVHDAPPDEARERGAPQRLLYAGSVGTGFTAAELDRLQALLGPLRREGSPFATPVDKTDAVFVEPRLVAELEFTEWTASGRLRHPSYKGLRADKAPEDVVREET